MKTIILTGALALTAIGFGAAPAQAYEGRWCAVHSMGRNGAYWECQFQTLEQCVPFVISGNRGFCNLNPAYVEPATKTRRVAHRHRHPRYAEH